MRDGAWPCLPTLYTRTGTSCPRDPFLRLYGVEMGIVFVVAYRRLPNFSRRDALMARPPHIIPYNFVRTFRECIVWKFCDRILRETLDNDTFKCVGDTPFGRAINTSLCHMISNDPTYSGLFFFVGMGNGRFMRDLFVFCEKILMLSYKKIFWQQNDNRDEAILPSSHQNHVRHTYGSSPCYSLLYKKSRKAWNRTFRNQIV